MSSAHQLESAPGPAHVLAFAVLGPPQGARRHRTAVRGRLAVQYHDDEHVRSEQEIAQMARLCWGDRRALDQPVRVELECWHRRPGRLLTARRWRGDLRRPYVGKPDADNVAKLYLDALTKAGVWVDDTRVHELVVRRWYLPVGQDGVEVGVPRVEVRLWTT